MEYQCILFDVVLFIYKYLNVGTLEQRDNKSGFYRKQKNSYSTVLLFYSNICNKACSPFLR